MLTTNLDTQVRDVQISVRDEWRHILSVTLIGNPKDPPRTVFNTESNSVVFCYSVVNLLRIVILGVTIPGHFLAVWVRYTVNLP